MSEELTWFPGLYEHKTFDNYPFYKEQWIYHFENGYGASVITGFGSYSCEEKPFELAVLKKQSTGKWGLDYDNPVAKGDVVGYITLEEAKQLLDEISEFEV